MSADAEQQQRYVQQYGQFYADDQGTAEYIDELKMTSDNNDDDDEMGNVEDDDDTLPLETLDGHTIYVHDGKQYLVPNELNQQGGTLVLQDENGDAFEIVLNGDGQGDDDDGTVLRLGDETDDQYIINGGETTDELSKLFAAAAGGGAGTDDRCYMVLGNNDIGLNDANLDGEQYPAIIKDGQLYFEATDLTAEQILTDKDGAPDDDDATTDDIEQVMGKNLITGETITLSGLFNKMRTKKSSTYDEEKVGSTSGTGKKVAVGKSTDGKKIFGRIVEIWKKDGDNSDNEAVETLSDNEPPAAPPPQPSTKSEKIEELLIDNTGRILKISKPWATTTTTTTGKKQADGYGHDGAQHKLGKLDYTISKTLTGLMDLETVQKRLIEKDLVIKVINKKCTDVGTRKSVSYLFGTMKETQTVNHFSQLETMWKFVLDATKHKDDTGLRTTTTTDDEDAGERETECMTLCIIEDRNGLKKTKVSIPNLGIGATKCSHCRKSFKTEQHLRKHMVHHTPKTITCEYCPKSFIDVSALQRHRRIHTGDKDYECDVCQKKFNTSGSLKRHVTVHNPSLRPLQCLTCYQRFTDESSLKKHMLIHTGVKAYECDLCFKTFINQGDLNFHRRIHDPLKCFTCDVCQKDFSRYSNLVRHKEIHKGENAAYSCNICGCAYNFVSSLTRHLVTNHIRQPSSGLE